MYNKENLAPLIIFSFCSQIHITETDLRITLLRLTHSKFALGGLGVANVFHLLMNRNNGGCASEQQAERWPALLCNVRVCECRTLFGATKLFNYRSTFQLRSLFLFIPLSVCSAWPAPTSKPSKLSVCVKMSDNKTSRLNATDRETFKFISLASQLKDCHNRAPHTHTKNTNEQHLTIIT